LGKIRGAMMIKGVTRGLKMYTFGIGISTLIFSTLIFTLSCEKKMELKDVEIDMKKIKDETIEALANKRVLFGHASVGNNIVNGIKDIMSADIRFRKINIRELKANKQLDEPGLYHFGVRKNSFPKKKCDHFKQVLTNGDLGRKADMAFFKLCYVDIEEDSNVQEIFDYYVDTIEYVKKEFPDIEIMHVTVPLYAHRWHLKGAIKRLIKPDIHNVKRNEFNTKLMEKYNDSDPIYDLARVESTYPDGRRSSFEYKAKTYFSLANEYTHDGGHLNKIGRYYAAKNLLKVLSEIALSQ